MNLSPKQALTIKESNKRLNIWEGAVRSSKTWASIFRFLRFVNEAPEGDLLIVAKTERTAYRNVVRVMEQLVGDDVKFNNGMGEAKIWGRTIYVVGANDVRSEGRIRGMTCAGAYGDELTLWPESFWVMLLSRMSLTGAKFFGTTNADNPFHWFKRGVIDREKELDLYLTHWELDDNPFISDDFKSALKSEYTGLWFRRFILGQWCVAEGAVYDAFSKQRNVRSIKAMPYPTSYSVSIDYGTSAPFVAGIFGENPNTRPKAWLVKEYVWDSKKRMRQKTDNEYMADLLQFTDEFSIQDWYVDPSAASLITLMRQPKIDGGGGLTNVIAANNDVIEGIRTQASMLHLGEYAVCEGCDQTISDYDGYSWDSAKQKIGDDYPASGPAEHTKDMERYYLHTKHRKAAFAAGARIAY